MRIVTGFTDFQDKISNSYKDAKRYGLDNILLDFNHFKTEAVLEGEEKVQYIAEKFIHQSKADGIELIVARTPVFGDYELSQYAAYRLEEVFWESLEAANIAGASYLLVEPFFNDEKQPWSEEHILDFYSELIPVAKNYGFKILIRNVPDNYNGNWYRGLLSDKNRFKSMLDSLNEKAGEKLFSIALDMGTANLLGNNIPELIRDWGSDITMILVSENNGNADEKGVPFTSVTKGISTIDWAPIIKTLREIDFDGFMLIDVTEIYWRMPEPLKKAFFAFVLQVAEYFKWQINLERTIRKYDKRVLFGAGNMCKEYMEHYGIEYPPMYTCDNNSSLWGKQAFGLNIKSPEELKKLDTEVAIFICNTFYEEITVQLKEMGLKNPIERFNDEIL